MITNPATKLLFLLLAAFPASCSSQPPEPLIVLENPMTGERAKFFRELPFKVPANYDEAKHMAQWRAEKEQAGFTAEVQK